MTYWTGAALREWAEQLAEQVENDMRVVSVDFLRSRLGSDEYLFKVEFTESAWALAKVRKEILDANADDPELADVMKVFRGDDDDDRDLGIG